MIPKVIVIPSVCSCNINADPHTNHAHPRSTGDVIGSIASLTSVNAHCWSDDANPFYPLFSTSLIQHKVFYLYKSNKDQCLNIFSEKLYNKKLIMYDIRSIQWSIISSKLIAYVHLIQKNSNELTLINFFVGILSFALGSSPHKLFLCFTMH